MLGNCNGTEIPKKVFNKEMFTKDVFHERGHCAFCHIVLDDSVMQTIKAPESGEKMWLETMCMNRNKKWMNRMGIICSSRLACQVPITKEMQGTTVFVPIIRSYHM